MNKLTDDELKNIANKLYAQITKGAGRGASSFSSNDNVRKSKRSTQEDDPSTFIEALDDLTDNVQSTIKRWVSAKREFGRAKFGSALKDATNDLYEALEEVASNAGKHSRALAKSYNEFILANKDNRKAQQLAYNKMQAYSKSVDEIIKITNTRANEQTEKDKNRAEELETTINTLSTELKRLGIEVGKVQRRHTNSGYSIKNKNQLKEILETNNELLKETENFVDNLKTLHRKELDARDKFVEGIESTIKTMSGIAANTVKNVLNSIESRQQTQQIDNQFFRAGDLGLSIQEFNNWMLENKNSMALVGSGTKQYQDQLKKELYKFGLINEDAAKRITELNNVQMISGISPNVSSAAQLQDVVAAVQSLENITKDEAMARMQEVANSDYFAATAATLGSGEERAKLLEDQLFTLKKIAMSTGFSAKYSEKMLQDAINNRNKGALDKLKTSFLAPVAMDMMEQALGVKFSAGEREGNLRRLMGGSITPERAKNIALFDRKSAGAMAKGKLEMSDSLVNQVIPENFGPFVAMESIMQKAGMSTEINTEAAKATYNKDTIGKSVEMQNFKAQVDASKNALSAFDERILIAKENIVGLGKSPIGGIGNFLLGALQFAAGGLIAKLLMRMGGTLTGIFRAGGRGMATSIVGGLATRAPAIGATMAGTLSTSITGALASGATLLSGAIAAALAGAAIGTGIRNLYMKTETGQKFDDALGSGIAHVLSFFGNDDATESIKNMESYQKSLETPQPVLNAKSTNAMTSGKVIDDNGNLVEVSNETNEHLKKIAENTGKTVDVVQEGNDTYAAVESNKAVEQLKRESLRDSVQRSMTQKTELFRDNFTSFGNYTEPQFG